ncbi:mitochondrial large subunit ribosomal protein-domain-containing protein [Xylariaceae sp. FL1272]|nr:mitochondrial large subunit ribosomal protein-domain-containing protein [Xylariaceae sp. FL1272]
MLPRTFRPLAASLSAPARQSAPSAVLPLSLRLRTLATATEPPTHDTTAPATKETNPTDGLPYFVARNSLMNFSVYDRSVAGGNKHITVIKRVEGNLRAFKEDLVEALELDPKIVRINSTNNHIHIGGRRERRRVLHFLETNGF